jgi:predicted nucleic acid-binding protein
VQTGQLVLVPTLAQNADAIAEKLRKYDRMDLADASLVALSEQYPHAKLITIDRTDFTIYRRRDGKPVPTIMPELCG